MTVRAAQCVLAMAIAAAAIHGGSHEFAPSHRAEWSPDGPIEWVLGAWSSEDRPASESLSSLPTTAFEKSARKFNGPRELAALGIGARRNLGEAQRILASRLSAHNPVWSNGTALELFESSSGNREPRAPRTLSYDSTKTVEKTQAGGSWIALSSTMELAKFERDLALLEPAKSGSWATDESLKVSVAGPLYFFGQFGLSSSEIEQHPQWKGKYGVGVKLKPRLLKELQVRGGPTMRSDDTGQWVRGPSGELTELFVEASTQLGVPGLGPINLEYTSVTESASTGERNLLNQDFRLARPLPRGGQVHVGAKYRWDEAPAETPWVDRMQVYMGIELKR
jgi:hypothetical protein